VRVVVVDDVLEMRRLLAEMLSMRGCEVVGEAEDGQRALEVLETTPCDVVIMDYRMPVMDGLQATSLVRAGWPDVRIAAFTSDGDPIVTGNLLAAGADAHFPKGHINDLVAYVAAIGA
jgi:CheY-like chemotaxis protein